MSMNEWTMSRRVNIEVIVIVEIMGILYNVKNFQLYIYFERDSAV